MKNYDAYSDEELLEMLRNGESSVAEYLMEKYKPLVRKRARALYLAGGDHEACWAFTRQSGNTSRKGRLLF